MPFNSNESKNLAKTNIVRLEKVNSTQKYLNDLLQQKELEEGFSVISKEQTAGKGQYQSNWDSEPGSNLLMSTLHYPINLFAENQFQLSKRVSLALLDALKPLVFEQSAKIKWPNDLFLNDKKAAGILIQCGLKGLKVQYAIIGIGLNVNQQDFGALQRATSLKNEFNVEFNVDTMALLVLEKLLKLNQDYSNEKHLNQRYLEELLGFNQWSDYQQEGTRIEGKILDVEKSGKLVLELRSGKTKSFDLKEISLV